MQRSQGHMDISLFRNLIDQIGDFLFLILLWDWGEPFLNPRIHEMIAYAKRKGIKLISSTNGHLFNNLKLADRVIESGLDTLIFAVDGVSQETYEKYRKRGRLETALEGVRTLATRKRELGSSTPLINFRFIVMRHNEHEIPSLKELAKSLGVDVLTLNPCLNNTYRGKEEAPAKHALELAPENHRYRRFDFAGNGDTPIHAPSNPCKSLWNAPAIHWDGKVCPCTFDYDDRFVLGDLKKETFEEVWRGRAYRRMRRMLRQKDSVNHFCNECSCAYKGGSLIDETIAEASFFVHT
jgi:radical SAM protein with 4Fe4S-binding SPASM domain